MRFIKEICFMYITDVSTKADDIFPCFQEADEFSKAHDWNASIAA